MRTEAERSGEADYKTDFRPLLPLRGAGVRVRPPLPDLGEGGGEVRPLSQLGEGRGRGEVLFSALRSRGMAWPRHRPKPLSAASTTPGSTTSPSTGRRPSTPHLRHRLGRGRQHAGDAPPSASSAALRPGAGSRRHHPRLDRYGLAVGYAGTRCLWRHPSSTCYGRGRREPHLAGRPCPGEAFAALLRPGAIPPARSRSGRQGRADASRRGGQARLSTSTRHADLPRLARPPAARAQRPAWRAGVLRPPRPHPGRPAVPPRLLEGGAGGAELPPLLQYRRPDRRARRGRGSVRRDPQPDLRPGARGPRRRPAHRPHRWAAPAGQYVERLQARLADTARLRAGAGPASTVVVEKDTLRRRALRESWPVAGTSGYEFADAATRALIDRPACRRSPAPTPASSARVFLRRHRLRREEARHARALRRRGAQPAGAAQPARQDRPPRRRHLPRGPRPAPRRGDCLPPRLPHLHRFLRRRPAGRAVRGGGARRRAGAGPRHRRAGPRLHAPAPAPRLPELSVGGEQTGVARLRHELAAVQQPGDGQGRRGYRILCLQPPPVAQRGGRRAGSDDAGRRRCTASTSGAACAGPRHERHVDPRHQAQRGRARPTRRPVGAADEWPSGRCAGPR